MSIKDMPHVTVEQVLALRKAAIDLEKELAALKASLPKIKADAARQCAPMPSWNGQPDDTPTDFDGYCQAIHDVHENANKLEAINED